MGARRDVSSPALAKDIAPLPLPLPTADDRNRVLRADADNRNRLPLPRLMPTADDRNRVLMPTTEAVAAAAATADCR